jgi:hypothetical protein
VFVVIDVSARKEDNALLEKQIVVFATLLLIAMPRPAVRRLPLLEPMAAEPIASRRPCRPPPPTIATGIAPGDDDRDHQAPAASVTSTVAVTAAAAGQVYRLAGTTDRPTVVVARTGGVTATALTPPARWLYGFRYVTAATAVSKAAAPVPR